MRPLKSVCAAVALALCPASAFAAGGDAASVPASLPDWSGVWMKEGAEPTISGFPDRSQPLDVSAVYPLVNPAGPWTEAGRAKLAAIFAGMGSRKSEGWGYPMMMTGSAPLSFAITPKLTVVYNPYRDMRQVFTDGRALPPEEDWWTTVWGTSVGHWEGDTLVIETVAVREPVVYFFFVPPFSGNARYTERLRMVAPDRIENTMTIDDPATLAAPWTVTVFYHRIGLDALTLDTFTNDRNELEDGVFDILPDGEHAE